MNIKATTKHDPPIFKHGYRITYIRNVEDEVIGVLIEGPRLHRPLYIPKQSTFPVKVKLPEILKKSLKKEGFNIE